LTVTNDRPLAFFAAALPAGGAEKAILTIAGGFAAKGDRVHLVLATAGGELMSQIPSGVALVDLQKKRAITSVAGLAMYLRRTRPVALISALTHANLVAIVATSAAATRTPVIVTEHTMLSKASRASSDTRERVMPTLVRFVYPHATSVVAVSQGVADDLRISVPRLHPQVIPNPVPTDLTERAKEATGHQWLDSPTLPVILGVGRLVQIKAFDVLIRAVASLQAQTPCRLVILGEGDARRPLESLIAELGLDDRVALPGHVENPYAWMARARVVALSSRREGLPTVLLEALSLGKAIVATDCESGPREILQGGRLGRLVPVDDAAALGVALADALSSAAPPRPPDAVANYSVDRVLKAYAELVPLR
jgi:glycosyltransferase involved in cell wall biosynthesis